MAMKPTSTANSENFTATTYEDNSMLIEFGNGPNAGTTIFMDPANNKVVIDKWGELDQEKDMMMNLGPDRHASEVNLQANQVDPLDSVSEFKSPVSSGMSEDGYAEVSMYEDGAIIIEIADGPNAGTSLYANPQAQELTVTNWGELNDKGVLMTYPRDERQESTVSTAPQQASEAPEAPAVSISPLQP